jgi:hypothetical protein
MRRRGRRQQSLTDGRFVRAAKRAGGRRAGVGFCVVGGTFGGGARGQGLVEGRLRWQRAKGAASGRPAGQGQHAREKRLWKESWKRPQPRAWRHGFMGSGSEQRRSACGVRHVWSSSHQHRPMRACPARCAPLRGSVSWAMRRDNGKSNTKPQRGPATRPLTRRLAVQRFRAPSAESLKRLQVAPETFHSRHGCPTRKAPRQHSILRRM